MASQSATATARGASEVPGVPALEVQGVTMRFGGLTALDDVCFEVPSGVVHGVIGPNGAGKTTLLNVLSGLQKPTAGTFTVHGDDAARWPAHRIVGRGGVVRTFQTVRLFSSMTVREHLVVAARAVGGSSAESRHDSVARVLDRLSLTAVADAKAASLPYGLQRRLELGRALASGPRLLLLDEPAAGLNPEERRRLGKDITELATEGVTVVLIEHHMDLVQSVCGTATVLNFGAVIAGGAIAAVMREPAVLEAYLGSGHDEQPAGADLDEAGHDDERARP